MITEDVIRQRSYEIWKREGCPVGRALENWLRAEIELTREMRMGVADSDSANPCQIVASRPPIMARPLITVSARVPRDCFSAARK